MIEVVAEALGKKVESKKVNEGYGRLIAEARSEMKLLLDLSDDQVYRTAPPEIAGGIVRMRRGEVLKRPGYDGVYGKVSVLPGLLADI